MLLSALPLRGARCVEVVGCGCEDTPPGTSLLAITSTDIAEVEVDVQVSDMMWDVGRDEVGGRVDGCWSEKGWLGRVVECKNLAGC